MDTTHSIEQALQLHQAGDLSNAEDIYRAILLDDPNHPVAMHFLGVIAHQVGKHEVAYNLISNALLIDPTNAEAHNNLGLVCQNLNRLDEAIANYYKALEITPDYAESHNNLGLVFLEQGNPDEAILSYRKAISLKAEYAEAYNNLGIALQVKNNDDDAIECFNKALSIMPNLAEAYFNLSTALKKTGQPDAALASQRHAIGLNPRNEKLWVGMAGSMEQLSSVFVDDTLRHDLLELLQNVTVHPSHLVRTVITALGHDPVFAQLIEQASGTEQSPAVIYRDIADRMSGISLFLNIIKRTPIRDIPIERALTHLRQALLLDTLKGLNNNASLKFSTALALQCFENDFIFLENDDEKQMIGLIEERIESAIESGKEIPPIVVIALGCYRPLYQYPWAQKLLEINWPKPMHEVMARQISGPLQEQNYAANIPSLTPITDPISRAVRTQYEENPYPRWSISHTPNGTRSIIDYLTGAPFHFDLTGTPSPPNPKILIAGCGTGRHSLSTATKFTNAQVLGIDLSIPSLAYALRKSNDLGVTNVNYAQADILEMSELGLVFDLIESVGVLHHLTSPLTGWRVLAQMLSPGGFMKVGLYSDISRQYIDAGHTLIAQKNYVACADDIRQCRQDIIDLAENGDPNMMKIYQTRDFFNLSNCRDLLFHTKEHRFTLPKIEAALEKLQLKFIGFEIHDKDVLEEFKTQYPDKNALSSLEIWHAFESNNPDTFGSMYQFWCQKM